MKVIKSIFSKIHPVVLIAPVLTFFLTSTMFVGATVEVPGNIGGIALGGGFGRELGGNACEGGLAANYRQNQTPTSVPNPPGAGSTNISQPGGGSSGGVIRAFDSLSSNFSGSGIITNSSPRCIANYWRGLDAVPEQITRTIDIADPRFGIEYVFDLSQFEGYPGPPVIDPIDVKANADDAEDERKFGYLIKTFDDGNLEVSQSSTGPRSVRATFYVDGNLVITSNITNNNEVSYATREDLGYLTFVVNGNIYIDKTVTFIDAVLVALAKDDVTPNQNPTIYSCADTTIDVSNPIVAPPF